MSVADIIALIPGLVALAVAVGTLWKNRNDAKIAAKQIGLAAKKADLDTLREIIDTLQVENKRLCEKIEALETDNEALSAAIDDLKEKNKALVAENEKLREKLDKLHKQVNGKTY